MFVLKRNEMPITKPHRETFKSTISWICRASIWYNLHLLQGLQAATCFRLVSSPVVSQEMRGYRVGLIFCMLSHSTSSTVCLVFIQTLSQLVGQEILHKWQLWKQTTRSLYYSYYPTRLTPSYKAILSYSKI